MNLSFFQVNERWLNGRAMTFGFLLVTFQLPEWQILMLSFLDQYNTWSQLFTYIPHERLLSLCFFNGLYVSLLKNWKKNCKMFQEKLKIQNKTDKTFCTSRLERYVIKKRTRRFFYFTFLCHFGKYYTNYAWF